MYTSWNKLELITFGLKILLTGTMLIKRNINAIIKYLCFVSHISIFDTSEAEDTPAMSEYK
jgi:hypothetical protein